MAKNLIYLCKNKLIGIDGALPVLMEVKSLFPKIKITIVFLNTGHRSLIKKNNTIWEGIESIDADRYVMKTKNKFITFLRLLRFISRFSFRDNIIIKDNDTLPLHRITMKVLKGLSRTKEIKTYLTVQSLEGRKNLYTKTVLSRQRKGKPVEMRFFESNYDYFLSMLKPAQFKMLFDIEAPKDKMVNTGYIRRLPQWQKHMKETIAKNKVINDSAYFLYILSNMGRRYPHFNEPETRELLRESLDTLKKYNGKIKTVFKPHAYTDIMQLEKLLKKLNYSNYVIDYSHPMVLSSKAKFIFGNNYSCTMFEAYYLRIPVVEYSQTDPELFDKLGRQSFGGRCCDFFVRRDQKKLDEVLDRLINSNVSVARDPVFIEENFPEVPKEFYEFWHKLFSKVK